MALVEAAQELALLCAIADEEQQGTIDAVGVHDAHIGVENAEHTDLEVLAPPVGSDVEPRRSRSHQLRARSDLLEPAEEQLVGHTVLLSRERHDASPSISVRDRRSGDASRRQRSYL
jgi:hypothetical protein